MEIIEEVKPDRDQCARRADERNLEKLKAAFAEEWARYSSAPKLTEQQHNAFPKGRW